MWIIANTSGKIDNLGDLKKVPSMYLPVLSEIEEIYHEQFGENLISLFVRGSVSTGECGQFSDLDIVGVTNEETTGSKFDNLLEHSKILQGKYTFVNGFELAFVTKNELVNNDNYFNLRLNLKSSSALIKGEDIRAILLDIIPGPNLSKEILDYTLSEFDDLKKYFNNQEDKSYLGEVRAESFWCSWIMRVLTRSGIGILMLEEKVYSNDVKLISRQMAQKYPVFNDFFSKAANWVIYPISDRHLINEFLENNTSRYFNFWKEQLTKTI